MWSGRAREEAARLLQQPKALLLLCLAVRVDASQRATQIAFAEVDLKACPLGIFSSELWADMWFLGSCCTACRWHCLRIIVVNWVRLNFFLLLVA